MYSFSVKPEQPKYDRPDLYANGYQLRTCDRLAQVCEYALRFCWSPIIWKDGIRKRDNFLSCGIAAIDVDEGTTIAQAREILHGCKNVILTTKSHQIEKSGKPPCDRFRILIPLDRIITDLNEYQYNMDFLRRELGADKCIDGARFFWPCKKFNSADTGDDFPVQKSPPVVRKEYPKYTRQNAPRLSRKLQDYMRYGVPKGQRHNESKGIMLQLLGYGFSEQEIVNDFIPRMFQPENAEDEKDIKRVLAWALRVR